MIRGPKAIKEHMKMCLATGSREDLKAMMEHTLVCGPCQRLFGEAIAEIVVNIPDEHIRATVDHINMRINDAMNFDPMSVN